MTASGLNNERAMTSYAEISDSNTFSDFPMMYALGIGRIGEQGGNDLFLTTSFNIRFGERNHTFAHRVSMYLGNQIKT